MNEHRYLTPYCSKRINSKNENREIHGFQYQILLRYLKSFFVTDIVPDIHGGRRNIVVNAY